MIVRPYVRRKFYFTAMKCIHHFQAQYKLLTSKVNCEMYDNVNMNRNIII